MSKLKKFHVRVELEALDARELPGNLLSAILASDFFPTDHRQLSLIPSSLTELERSTQKGPAAVGTDLSETMVPERPIAQDGGATGPITQTNNDASSQLDDFRNTMLARQSFDAANTTAQEGMPTFKAGQSDSNITVLATYLATVPAASSQEPSVEPASSNNMVRIALPGSDPDEELLTTAASRKITNPTMMSSFIVNPPLGDIHQDVPINANDDNGSAIVDYIPNKYDFEATQSDYPPMTADPELVAMQMETVNPLSPELDHVEAQGVINYTLTISQPPWIEPPVGGHIRLWDSPYKDHEYTVFGSATTQNLQPLVLTPGLYLYPIIYLEGTEPSLIDDEMTINLDVKELLSDGSTYTFHMRTVKATVTPRIDTFKVEQPPISGTFFQNGPNGEIENSTKYGYTGYAQFYAVLMGVYGRGIPKLLQNVIAPLKNQLLNDTMAITLNNASPLRVKLLGERTLPLLDSDNTNNPFYAEDYAWRNGNKPPIGIDPNNPRKYVIATSDSPKSPLKNPC